MILQVWRIISALLAGIGRHTGFYRVSNSSTASITSESRQYVIFYCIFDILPTRFVILTHKSCSVPDVSFAASDCFPISAFRSLTFDSIWDNFAVTFAVTSPFRAPKSRSFTGLKLFNCWVSRSRLAEISLFDLEYSTILAEALHDLYRIFLGAQRAASQL